MSNETQKKRKVFKKFKALAILILIILVLLLLDGRFGLGPGGSSLFSNSQNSESEKDNVSSKQVIEIRESEIFYKNQALTIDALKIELENNKNETIYVLKDAMANYGVFSQVEQLLKDLALAYTIE